MKKKRVPAPAIGPRIQAIRKKQHLSLEELSARSGVSKSMLSQIERGEANPTFATLWNLTRALDLEFSDLIGMRAQSGPGAIEIIPAISCRRSALRMGLRLTHTQPDAHRRHYGMV